MTIREIVINFESMKNLSVVLVRITIEQGKLDHLDRN